MDENGVAIFAKMKLKLKKRKRIGVVNSFVNQVPLKRLQIFMNFTELCPLVKCAHSLLVFLATQSDDNLG